MTQPLEPGLFPDLNHGLPGDAEPHPGLEPDEPTGVNDDEDVEES